MKTVRTFAALLCVMLLLGNTMAAQKKTAKAKAADKSKATEATAAAADAPMFITVTTLHRNLDMKDFPWDAWKASEKEYFDKVTKKNELILGQEMLTHYFTADNSEILLVTMYKSWDDIEKANDRDNDLIKAAWPDDAARKAYFQKRADYYAHNHSDEIYNSYANAKMSKTPFTKPMLFYVRKSHFAYPKDGSEKEFKELMKSYVDAVTNKNDYIKGYYPNVHAWGANNTEFTEVYVVENLDAIEKGFEKDDELFKAAWPDEAKRKDYESKMDKYFTGSHGDYIYRSVPELTK